MKDKAAPTPKQLIGSQAESQAASYLEQKGLRLIESNFRCKLGEIDLIMLDKNTLVFVEVRYRKNANFGSALETVNRSKQKKIIAASQFYLRSKAQRISAPLRFDVVGITGEDIAWVPSAFYAEY